MGERAATVSEQARALARAAFLLLATCSLAAARAHGQRPVSDATRAQPQHVYARLGDCGAPPWTREASAELLRALALELHGDGTGEVRALAGTSDVADASAALLELDVDCASGELVLRARSARAAQPSSRRMELHDVPAPLQPRALALALAELLRTSERAAARSTSTAPADAGTQPAASAASSTSPADSVAASPRARDPDRQEPTPPPAYDGANAARARDAPAVPELAGAAASDQPDPTRRHALWLAPNTRLLLAGSDALYGVAGGWQWRRLSAGLDALFSRAGDTLGATYFGVAHAGVSYRLLQLRLGAQTVFAGPALGAGVTWASAGSSASANGGSALLASYELGAQLGVSRELTTTLGAGLCLEGGYARGPTLRAGDRELATLSGAFLGIALRLSFSLER